MPNPKGGYGYRIVENYKYQFIKAEALEKLEARVFENMAKGDQLYGSPFFDGKQYIQAMLIKVNY